MSTGNNKSKLGPVLIIMALAVIVLGVLLYLRSEEKHEIALEKQALTMELADMKEDLEAQVGQNDSLNAFVQYEMTRLGGIIDSINAVNVQNKKSLTGYRSRLGSMKRANAALVGKLDSANAAYEALRLHEQLVADSLNTAMDANTSLRDANTGLTETVAKGKQLVIATSTTEAFRIAGNGKMRRTRRAKKADGITACITLAKNRIAAKGEETLYVKWIGENGKPVDAPEQNQAVVGGEQSGFNGKAVVNFQGEAIEICIDAKRAIDAPVNLAPGIYTLALMTDSYLVGTVAVELK